MQASQSGTEKQLARTAVNLQNSIAAVAALEKDLEAAGEKFTFLQAMRAYIADLCDMLQVRSPSLGPFVSHIKMTSICIKKGSMPVCCHFQFKSCGSFNPSIEVAAVDACTELGLV